MARIWQRRMLLQWLDSIRCFWECQARKPKPQCVSGRCAEPTRSARNNTISSSILFFARLGPPVVTFSPFLVEGSPTKVDYRKKLVPLFHPLYCLGETRPQALVSAWSWQSERARLRVRSTRGRILHQSDAASEETGSNYWGPTMAAGLSGRGWLGRI